MPSDRFLSMDRTANEHVVLAHANNGRVPLSCRGRQAAILRVRQVHRIAAYLDRRRSRIRQRNRRVF